MATATRTTHRTRHTSSARRRGASALATCCSRRRRRAAPRPRLFSDALFSDAHEEPVAAAAAATLKHQQTFAQLLAERQRQCFNKIGECATSLIRTYCINSRPVDSVENCAFWFIRYPSTIQSYIFIVDYVQVATGT